MENASDALIMAGEMLIFIVALTVCISSFTKVRVEIDKIVGQKETVQMAKNGDEYINYIKSKETKSIRVVGAETLLPSMYRAIKENYVIYIKLKDYENSYIADSGIVLTKATKNVYVVIRNNDGSTNSTQIIKENDKIIKITIGSKTAEINQNVNAILKDNGKKFFNYIKGKEFYEYLGEYQDWAVTGVSSEDRAIHRIITYVETT